jgi:hypothetical protein
MTEKKYPGGRRVDDRRIYVRGIRHEKPDLRRLARVLVEFARAEAEAQAAAEHKAEVQAAGGKLDVAATTDASVPRRTDRPDGGQEAA